MRKIYEGKTVLVTGHTGFKGSWLSEWLLLLGAKVVGVSDEIPTQPSHFQLLNLDQNIQDFRLDIRDYAVLEKVIIDVKPDMVFHLAAQPIVRTSYEDPRSTFETNVNGTLNLLEACRQVDSVGAIVLITSDKAYRNKEWVWGYREDDELGGEDPYSASKGCAELVIRSYVSSFYQGGSSPRVASARAGNVIGGGDWSDYRIIPDCVKAWSDGRELEIHHPEATRPWQHVLEPLSGYLWLGAQLLENKTIHGESYNFGPDAKVTQSVEALLKQFSIYWDQAKWRVIPQDTLVKESSLLKLCCDKAMIDLNWEPTLSFEETVKFTSDWYARYYEGDQKDLLTKNQIQAYIAIAQSKGLEWAK